MSLGLTARGVSYTMILTKHNEDGFIYAYFYWDVVDSNGVVQDDSYYMCVRKLWVHPSYDARHIILEFIKELDEDKRNKNVLWIYWEREKKGKSDRLSKTFRRATALRRIQCLLSKK